MAYLFLFISVIAGCAKSTFSKLLSPYSSTHKGFGITNALLSLSACTVIVAVCVFSADAAANFAPYTLIAGLLFGVCTTASQLFYMRAMDRGAVSVVTFVYSCGFLLPTAAGTLFWSEPLTLPLIIGLLILICAFVLCACAKTENTIGKSIGIKRGIAPALAAMCCSGILGILQKLHQTSAHKSETTGFLVTAFIISATLSFVVACVDGQKTHDKILLPNRAILYAIVGGLFIGAANIVNLRLSGMLPAAICFPITNGGVVVLSATMGRILFREKLSRGGYMGIALGLIAIVVIGLGK